jgi:hypothetical protein
MNDEHARQCNVWAREWCQNRDVKMKQILYEGLITAQCISKDGSASYYKNEFLVYPNVDCSNGGRIHEGSTTLVKVR